MTACRWCGVDPVSYDLTPHSPMYWHEQECELAELRELRDRLVANYDNLERAASSIPGDFAHDVEQLREEAVAIIARAREMQK